MLKQNDIDDLKLEIDAGETPTIYYVANYLELREGMLDESNFKSNPKYRVVEVQVEDIQNAYFEYLNYIANPDNYHIESETNWYDPVTQYVHYYITPNAEESYTKDINPRMPSAVYGMHKELYLNGELESEWTDPTPIDCNYTNLLELNGYTTAETLSKFEAGDLDWKYKELEYTNTVDGVEYSYISSDWYILRLKNLPKVEHTLMKAGDVSSFFINIDSAFHYVEQLML